MERLTTYICGYAHGAEGVREDSLTGNYCRGEFEATAIVDRLAAYEDTGLEPEEIARILDAYGRGMTLRTENAQRLEIVKGIQTDRLRELAQADRGGRCVVLPAKPVKLSISGA